jgi:hypothetical protein
MKRRIDIEPDRIDLRVGYSISNPLRLKKTFSLLTRARSFTFNPESGLTGMKIKYLIWLAIAFVIPFSAVGQRVGNFENIVSIIHPGDYQAYSKNVFYKMTAIIYQLASDGKIKAFKTGDLNQVFSLEETRARGNYYQLVQTYNVADNVQLRDTQILTRIADNLENIFLQITRNKKKSICLLYHYPDSTRELFYVAYDDVLKRLPKTYRLVLNDFNNNPVSESKTEYISTIDTGTIAKYSLEKFRTLRDLMYREAINKKVGLYENDSLARPWPWEAWNAKFQETTMEFQNDSPVERKYPYPKENTSGIVLGLEIKAGRDGYQINHTAIGLAVDFYIQGTRIGETPWFYCKYQEIKSRSGFQEAVQYLEQVLLYHTATKLGRR